MSYRVGPPPPPWCWEIGVDFVLSAAGAGTLLVAAASGDAGLHARGSWIAAVLLAASLAMLVLDLGRPSRFWRMLSSFNPRSVMSWGAWILNGCFAVALMGCVATPPAWRAAALLLAPLVLVYKGVLLSVTAVPLWRTGRLFGPLFLADGISLGALVLGQNAIVVYAVCVRAVLMLLVFAGAGGDRSMLSRRWSWWAGLLPLVGSIFMRVAILRAPYGRAST